MVMILSSFTQCSKPTRHGAPEELRQRHSRAFEKRLRLLGTLLEQATHFSIQFKGEKMIPFTEIDSQ